MQVKRLFSYGAHEYSKRGLLSDVIHICIDYAKLDSMFRAGH